MCRNTKRRKSDTPVMMSGLSIGMLFRKVMACFPLPLMLWMPMAAIVPSRVDTVAAMRAITRVFLIASMSEPVPCIVPVNRFEYSFVENPVQLPRTLLSVNENTAMKTIGA